jgi:hypothetical protein
MVNKGHVDLEMRSGPMHAQLERKGGLVWLACHRS